MTCGCSLHGSAAVHHAGAASADAVCVNTLDRRARSVWGSTVSASSFHALLPSSTAVRRMHEIHNLLHVANVRAGHLCAGLDLYSLHTSADYVIRYLDKVGTSDKNAHCEAAN